MINVAQNLKNAAEKTGFVREYYNDQKVPADASSVLLIPHFGDLNSSCIFSALLHKRIKDVMPSRYIVIISWPGHRGLYPYADEYWSLSSQEKLDELYAEAKGFENNGRLATLMHRNFNRFFDVLNIDEIACYHQGGLTDDFWRDFKHVELALPSIPSATILGNKFINDLQRHPGYKVFLAPSLWMNRWAHGKVEKFKCPKEFWTGMVERLLRENFIPVLYRNHHTHDVSDVFVGKCLYITDPDILKVMGAMRAVGCCLDVFSDFAKLPLIARCPYVSVVERAKFNGAKDYEFDDLCGQYLQKEYIFSFPTIIDNSRSMSNIYDSVTVKLKKFVPNIDYTSLPPASQSATEVSYETVRQRKMNKLGTHFISIPRDKELE